jgi:hypothetical protein
MSKTLRIRIATVAVLVSLVSVASAQEPIKFRGAFIGEPVADFIDCSAGKGKLLKEVTRPTANFARTGRA